MSTTTTTSSTRSLPGPRSQSGKEHSRRNARTHGLTGSVLTLSTEERADYDDRLARLHDALDPRDEAQRTLVGRVALCAHRLDRIARQEAVALEARVRQAPKELARARMARVLELGRRLMDDPVRRCNEELNDLDHPALVAWRLDEPLLLVMELEETIQGCDWLLDRWREISDVLDDEGFLHYDNKFKLIRMLGKRPETLLEDRRVGDLVLACRALHPETWKMVNEADMTSWGAENRPMYDKRVELLERRLPDAEAALDRLRATIDGAVARLEGLRAGLAALWEVEQAEASALATFDASKEGVLRRRYETANEREAHRSLALLAKLKAAAPEAPAPPEGPAPAEAEAPAKGAAALRNESPPTAVGHPAPGAEAAPMAPARAAGGLAWPELVHAS